MSRRTSSAGSLKIGGSKKKKKKKKKKTY